MALAQKREKFKGIEVIVGSCFSRLPFSPNFYTLSSIVVSFFGLYFLIKVKLLVALFFFVSAILLDFVDGAVARYCNKSTKIGAYLDTICDRYVEGMILFGFLFLPLKKIGLPPAFWIFLLVFGSILITYSKAAAKEKEILKEEFKKGFIGRAERMILIIATMITGVFSFYWMSWEIVILSILFNIAAMDRIYLAIGQAREGS